MPTQTTKTASMICPVPTDQAHVVATITPGDPAASGWSALLEGVFVKGGNAGASVDLGSGATVANKLLEISAVLKETDGKTAPLSLMVAVGDKTVALSTAAAPGDSASYSILVLFTEAA